MPVPMKHLKVDKNTVYQLNKQGTNRFSMFIQPGQDDQGNQINKEEIKNIADIIALLPEYMNLQSDIESALGDYNLNKINLIQFHEKIQKASKTLWSIMIDERGFYVGKI